MCTVVTHMPPFKFSFTVHSILLVEWYLNRHGRLKLWPFQTNFRYFSMPSPLAAPDPATLLKNEAYVKLVQDTREALRVFFFVNSSNTPVTRLAMEELVNTTVRSTMVL